MPILVILILLIAWSIQFYRKTFSPVRIPESNNSADLYISTGTQLPLLVQNLFQSGFISDTAGFTWFARRKNLDNHIHPGYYVITKGMRINDLINLIRSGKQTPVKVLFHNTRTLEELSGMIGRQLEADSLSLITLLIDTEFIEQKGWTRQTLPALFVPNTYEFFWNTSARQFFNRMEVEYRKFWSDNRLEKAKILQLTSVEVSTLASIVDEETYHKSEMPKIAGVYLDRLKKGYRLQADPTIRFARRDFSGKRVLTKDLQIDSPYNTYRHYGLPPGPIRIPSIQAIVAVLNPDRNGYLYFCAKEDFSGYHNFSKSLKEHNRNAAKYRKALNQRRIYR